MNAAHLEVSEARYVGFPMRAWAALTDGLFFQLVAFLIILAVYRSDYVRHLETTFATMMKLVQPPIDFTALRQAPNSSYSSLEGATYFWLPALATLFFWVVCRATPGLMAIPAQIVDVRTARRPSTLRLVLRLVAAELFSYAFGLDYLWIAFSKKETSGA